MSPSWTTSPMNEPAGQSDSRWRSKEVHQKPAERVLSGAVRPVKSGPTRTTAVKINNRYAQVNSHFHAQPGTCPASLPSWPFRFDPGHPLHSHDALPHLSPAQMQPTPSAV